MKAILPDIIFIAVRIHLLQLTALNLIGFTNDIQFSDTNNIEIYKEYNYKIRAVDKGGLLSEESNPVNDQVYEIAAQIFPSNDSLVNYFSYFTIKTIKVPANYRILVQTNEYYGEYWSNDFSSNVIDDAIQGKVQSSISISVYLLLLAGDYILE